MVALRHRVRASRSSHALAAFAFCAAARLEAEACRDAMLDQIAAARRPRGAGSAARRGCSASRVEITALLKSLGSMDPDARAAEAPEDPRAARGGHARHRRRARRRSKPPSSNAGSRPRRSTCRCRRPTAPRGTVHPVSQVMDELAEIFADLGFAVAEGPEIETQWYNFTALNMPENHPARAMQDTFYLEPRDAGRGAARAAHAHFAGADPGDAERMARRSGSSRRAASTAPTATPPTRRCSTRSRAW